ncbi:Pth4p PWA37_002947 [Arxiozyma heterogenica]|uniref:Prokaryotic-type class I peptide chain release factors domain-containing protein n=1 Tax=Arxiozyma heterogenica TaxID=278026 RepID=A0AAN7WJS3_9SACH|nr:hypothetical protein RI543_004524 [Kazachstania heterogenica]
MIRLNLKLRFYSVETAKEWLKNLNTDTLPQNIFTFRYDRSSGPGGQNVNKLNTKCTLTLYNASQCSLIPEEIRSQLFDCNPDMLHKKFRYYYPNSDSVVVQCDETRSRLQNKNMVVDKLITEIKSCCYFSNDTDPETKLKWARIKKRSHEKRLRNKKYKSDKKKYRKVNLK